MSNRPLGISLLCGFFGLIGLSSIITAISVGSDLGQATFPPDLPPSVRLFLVVAPVFFLLLGVLGLYAAGMLWMASPYGRLSGLIWVGLWTGSEVVLGIWGFIGPEIIQPAAPGFFGIFVRLIVSGAIFYYLWTTGARYVGVEPSLGALTGQ